AFHLKAIVGQKSPPEMAPDVAEGAQGVLGRNMGSARILRASQGAQVSRQGEENRLAQPESQAKVPGTVPQHRPLLKIGSKRSGIRKTNLGHLPGERADRLIEYQVPLRARAAAVRNHCAEAGEQVLLLRGLGGRKSLRGGINQAFYVGSVINSAGRFQRDATCRAGVSDVADFDLVGAVAGLR